MRLRTQRPRVAAVTCIIALLSGGCGDDTNAPTAVSIPQPPIKPPVQRDPQQLRKEGLMALEAREVDQADELARAAIALSPNDPENIFFLAIVLSEQNRFAEAIKRLENLAEQVPSTRLPVWGQTADWMVEQGRWLEAEQRCIEILDERPDAVPVHRLLVQLYTRQGRRLDVAKHLQALCRLGNIEEPELQSLLRTFYSFAYDVGEEDYGPIGKLGVAHYEISAGDWNAAANTLSQLSDRNAAESALLGRIFAQRQDSEQLTQWVATAPESAKLFADYWFAIGVHQAQQGEHVEAIKSFAATVVRDHTDHRAYLQMSRSLEAIGANDQAAEAAKRAEQIELTQVIADELTAISQSNLQRMAELADLLEQLQRPFEALSWRAVLLAYGRSSVSESQAQQMMTEINEARLQLLESDEPIPSRQFLLCGITPELLQRAEGASAATDADE